MDRTDWQEIRSAIYNALDDYDCDVYYYYPTKDGCCGFFSVTINDDDVVVDYDDIDSCLSNVIFEYDLTWDDESEDGDFDLNADWDRI